MYYQCFQRKNHWQRRYFNINSSVHG